MIICVMSALVLETVISVTVKPKLTVNPVLSVKTQKYALIVTEQVEYGLTNINHSFFADSLAFFMIIFALFP